MVSSGAEAKRLIQQNGVRLDGEPVTDVQAAVTPEMLPVVLQVGKRKFVRLIPLVTSILEEQQNRAGDDQHDQHEPFEGGFVDAD